MLRNFRKVFQKNNLLPTFFLNRNFLTNDYKCTEAWNTINSSPLIDRINLNDFYNQLEQSYASKGVVSAIDIDIFAHALKDPVHLEELKELLHKLRLSAETRNMLESTHHATIRNFIKYNYVQELVEILRDPLNFGVFLDDYTANIVLDELLRTRKFDLAADVASFVMLQEAFGNELTSSFCQYAAYKYIANYTPPEPEPPADPKTKKKVEEIKIRIKFLRNPYFDDHFDIKERITLSGKTLAWVSEQRTDNLSNNLQLLGCCIYKKYDKLFTLCQQLTKSSSFKLYKEVLELLQKEKNAEAESNNTLEDCITMLSKAELNSGTSLEESLKTAIENAINKVQNRDVEEQKKLFKSWVTIREQKLDEQTKRLDRAKRMQLIQEKQKKLEEEEQKLWFFENEEKIELQIEEKEKQIDTSPLKKKALNQTDEDYVPPEILPQRK